MEKLNLDSKFDVYFDGAGAVLAQARHLKKKTLEDVALLIGVNKSTLHRYETNATPVPGHVIEAIAQALNIRSTVLMKDCLMAMRPKLKSSAFGKLITTMVGEE
jgi:transcriptional regulator with XRE-family HTH domain